jgi:hypothetical protein
MCLQPPSSLHRQTWRIWNDDARAVSVRLAARWRINGRYLFDPRWSNSECMVPCTYRDGISVPGLGGHVMRLSSSFVAPSAIALLSAALLCGPSGAAMSQTATASAPLPSITVEAPKQVARPQRSKQVADTGGSRRRSPAAQTASAPPDSVLGKLATLEKASSSCNGGCETSFKSGNAPWVGCSYSAGINYALSSTCRDTLTYQTYLECTNTKVFLGWILREARWHCGGLLAGGHLAGEKRQVAELKRSVGR